MKDIKVIEEKLSVQGISLDIEQLVFLEEFIEHDAMYKPKTFFSRSQSMGNIYLWGPVGRGKTMLLQAIQDCYFTNYVQFHFIEFMQLVHNKLADFSGRSDPLKMIVKYLSRHHKMIFIDEFQIEDIADAMIIGTLIDALIIFTRMVFKEQNFLKPLILSIKISLFIIYLVSKTTDSGKLPSSIALVKIEIVMKALRFFYCGLLAKILPIKLNF